MRATTWLHGPQTFNALFKAKFAEHLYLMRSRRSYINSASAPSLLLNVTVTKEIIVRTEEWTNFR